jgi:hypothetical protein
LIVVFKLIIYFIETTLKICKTFLENSKQLWYNFFFTLSTSYQLLSNAVKNAQVVVGFHKQVLIIKYL